MPAFRNALSRLRKQCAASFALLIAFGASIALASDAPSLPIAPPPSNTSPVLSEQLASAPSSASPATASAPAAPPLNHLADKGPAKLPAEVKAALPPPVVPEVSQAEQITRLERTIEEERSLIEKLRADVQAPDSEFNLAETAFKSVDLALSEAKYDAETFAEDGDAAGQAAAEAKITDLSKTWKLARERFDLAIETRKTLQQQIAALEEKLSQDRTALDRLKGVDSQPATPVETTEPATVVVQAVAETSTSPAPSNTAAPRPTPTAAPGLPASAIVAASAPQATATTPSEPPAADPAPAVAREAVKETSDPTKPVSKELVKAKSDAHQKKEEAAAAEREVQSVAGRIAALERNIGLEQKLLVSAQKKSDIAFQTRAALDEDYDKRTAEGSSAAELAAIRDKLREADRFFGRSRAEVRERTERLTELQQQLADLQREELAALNDAKAKQREAVEAEEVVSELSNPYAIRNLLQWLLDHGPKIGLILVAMLVLRLFAVLSSQRFVTSIIERGARGTKQEREDRARTLMGVFRNAFSITIVVGGVLMLCEESGIAIAPLMGGAAVLGLAAAFGAQNLIRDYFYGFVILIENQYKINDVLRIGEMSGQVEQITLRMTVLRDMEGCVHFIPNGKIDSVTNMTHGWSRALLEVGVSYKENVDHVMEVLVDLAIDLRRDPVFGPLIIDNPEMLGVDGFGESSVSIKMLMKTRPLQQWKVKREMLRRIKHRFDQLGIEIPFPQRIVHHRMDGTTQASDETTEDLPWKLKKAA